MSKGGDYERVKMMRIARKADEDDEGGGEDNEGGWTDHDRVGGRMEIKLERGGTYG